MTNYFVAGSGSPVFFTFEINGRIHFPMAPCVMYRHVVLSKGNVAYSTHSIAGKAEALLKAFLFKDFIKTNENPKLGLLRLLPNTNRTFG